MNKEQQALEVVKPQLAVATVEKLALAGDVSGLTREEKIGYYKSLCERVGLDPATQPFKLLKLQGKEIFYCDRSGAQQLSRLHGVSHEIRAREVVHGCYVVTARASTQNGRASESIGAVPVENLKGEALCNAYMKAETKAKRRATLDLLGLGMLDESEVDSIPGAKREDSPVALLQEKTEPLPVQPVPTPTAASQRPKKVYQLKADPAIESAPDYSRFKARFLQRVEEAGVQVEAWDWATSTGAIKENQRLVDIPDDRCPRTKNDFDAVMDTCQTNHALGIPQELAERYDKAHVDDQIPDAEVPTSAGQPWRDIIIPIPRKSMTRDEYLKDPDTVGSLYDAVHSDGDARSRLWWLVEKWQVTTEYTGKDGKVRQRRDTEIAADNKLREALDQFKAWNDANVGEIGVTP